VIERQPISVRNPRAVRPWQHVLECFERLSLARRAHQSGTENFKMVSPFNFGPEPSRVSRSAG